MISPGSTADSSKAVPKQLVPATNAGLNAWPAAPRPADYQALFRKSPTPLLVVDGGTLRVVAANEAATRVFGYGEEEFLRASFRDLIPPQEREVLAGLMDPASRLPYFMESRSWWNLRTRSGGTARVEVAPGALPIAGRPCFLLFQPPEAEPTAQDVGVALPGGLSEFSFAALHDLKEPLHLIRGYLSLLRQEAGPKLDPKSQEYLEYAFSGTQRMHAIVLSLLEYFRADVRGIAREPVNLGDLLDDAVSGLRLQISESGGQVTREGLPTLLVDRMQLGRVFQNILSNALKFHGAQPPRIHVAAQQAGDVWDVCVRDNGIGIAEKDRERVLTPFQRVHSTDEFPGTGLGLSTSKKVVEMHGGKLWIASAPGQGTEIHFTLPGGA